MKDAIWFTVRVNSSGKVFVEAGDRAAHRTYGLLGLREGREGVAFW